MSQLTLPRRSGSMEVRLHTLAFALGSAAVAAGVETRRRRLEDIAGEPIAAAPVGV